jgi:alpha-glucosidase
MEETMKRLSSSAALCAIVVLLPSVSASGQRRVISPDGHLALVFDLDSEGRPVYSVDYNGRSIVAPSSLGLDLDPAPDLEGGFAVVDAQRRSCRRTWRPVCGQWATIDDHFNELVATLEEQGPPRRRLVLTFRAYDEGVALCYTIPGQGGVSDLTIAAERTQFRFAGDHTAYAVYSAQGRYTGVRLSQVRNNCERPLTLEIDDDLFVVVGEARLVDYARMRLSPIKGDSHALVSSLSGEVKGEAPLTTPWRTILVGRSPGQLLERSYLTLNLNEPCAIEDTSWIKPGKVIREVTLTTEGGKACVDFAVAHNLQYVEYDAGWYGHEYSDGSDATTISVDPKRSPGPLDLHAVIDYAARRGIGIIVYVNRRALERQLDEILPLYESWGIKGVKYGFVQVGSQRWTRWLHEAVRKAARHHLMVDVHDEYRPTGYSRTYPNLMTQEGIGGDETRPTNEQTLTILFTRMLAGAGDNTICYYNSRVEENACHAYQLAKAVCFYSPWQFLFWYDRPSAYQGEPEIEFYEHCPTVWDDTLVLHGRIGQYAVIARRSGDEWFVGCMNGPQARELPIPLDFLEPITRYTAHIYSHDASVPTRTHVRIERLAVTARDTLTAKLTTNGGQAIRIVPDAQ